MAGVSESPLLTTAACRSHLGICKVKRHITKAMYCSKLRFLRAQTTLFFALSRQRRGDLVLRDALLLCQIFEAGKNKRAKPDLVAL